MFEESEKIIPIPGCTKYRRREEVPEEPKKLSEHKLCGYGGYISIEKKDEKLIKNLNPIPNLKALPGQIPGYTGYVSHNKAENMFGMRYGQMTK